MAGWRDENVQTARPTTTIAQVTKLTLNALPMPKPNQAALPETCGRVLIIGSLVDRAATSAATAWESDSDSAGVGTGSGSAVAA